MMRDEGHAILVDLDSYPLVAIVLALKPFLDHFSRATR